jgi:TPR repeat protein
MSINIIIRYAVVGLLLLNSTVYAADDSSQLQKAIEQYLERNISGALPVFTKLAEQNDPEAHYYLGLIYTEKQSQFFNPELGISHLKSAISLEHAGSMFQMGVLYDNGIGVKQDALVAIDWYRKAKAAEKITNSKIVFYKEKNSGLKEVEYKEIFLGLLKKAEDGDAEIQFQVARLYDEGKLIPRDFTKALNWYAKSAKNSYREAQFMMGYFYCRGIGVDHDLLIANDWFKKSESMTRCTE